MSKFLLLEVSAEHHKKCIEKCGKKSGAMLKCMNLQAADQKPCTKVIHVECASYELCFVELFTNYFCPECAAPGEDLHNTMEQIEAAANKILEEKSRQDTVTKAEYDQLKSVAVELDASLKDKIQKVTQQQKEIETLKAHVKQQKEESDKQAAELKLVKESIAKLSKDQTQSSSGTKNASIIDRFNETLRLAGGHLDQSIDGRNLNNSSIAHSVFNVSTSHNGWPDYEEQHRSAANQDEHSLLLIRGTIAKPVPFDGDVTKWATFLSEFVRTSARGHYRDFEDMDRLRDLITGEAREMFNTELSDPCAEVLPTLKRLDEFFGIRGSAVRVALDRITQLPKIEKVNDKQRIKNLYTQAKQFALQCRIHNHEQELTAEASLYILESKMFVDHSKTWRAWTKINNKQEDVDGAIAFLEETIRELNFKAGKIKPAMTATVNATEVTGGRDESPKEPATSSGTAKKAEENSPKEKKRGKKKNRYADCECFECKEKHPFYKCPRLIEATSSKREAIVKRHQVCQRCLCSNKHKIEDCPNRCLRCYITGCTTKNRHPLLHGHTNEELPKFATLSAHIDVHFLQMASHFAMVPGDVIAADGSHIPITIMYDLGSGISLATQSLFQRAKYDSEMEYELTLRWATEITHTENNAKVFSLKFLPQGKSKAVMIHNLSAVEALELPKQSQDAAALKEQFPHLQNVPLPSYQLQSPQILLGLSHSKLMAHLSTVSGKRDQDPVGALTPLGWTLFGNCSKARETSDTTKTPMILGFTCSTADSNDISNDELLKCIRSCSDVDSIGIAHSNASLLSAEDQQAEKIIRDTMRFVKEEGRYEVGLLWKTENDSMPDNYEQAVQRLASTEKRLNKLGMMEFVREQFNEQIKNGWLVQTTREEANQYKRRNYVYGFITFNNNKSPPKPRFVNDTASTYKGVSLNSKLLKGPDNLVPLPQSMCCLREGKIAYQGDVKAMFNQVLLKKEDQFSQLTLWRDGDESSQPRIYRQTRVIFGPASSPSETGAVRIKHATDCKNEFPEASDVAINQMYVDDAGDSRDTVEEAAKVANDLIKMFAKISWPLVQFQSNSPELLSRLPQECVSQKMIEISNDKEELITKVLGIFWKPLSDTYVYRMNDDALVKKCTEEGYAPTKREMLSLVMKIFDPLGHIAPFRIRGQMILQQVWKAGTDWRKKPPQDISDAFIEWLKDFQSVAKLEIPRAYSNIPLKDCEISLHVFVDAGTEAYAACVYIRIKHQDDITVRLVAAKARVAPLKYMSIPRLELMSALIGSRLIKAVSQWHRRLKFIDYTCWTDSEVVYKWIRARHLPRTAFTAPRISEIQELTSADRWRHVPTKVNVADFGTKEREMNYSDFTHEWHTGPKFLYQGEETWPKSPEITTKTVEISINVARVENGIVEDIHSILTSVSSKVRANWTLLVRVVSIALRFVDYLLPQRPHHRRTGRPTLYEIERAENYVLRLVQQRVFPDEYKTLLKNQTVKKASPIFSLSPVMCEKTKLIRATTRLSENFPLNMRSPPILPNFHEISDSIVRHYHNINLHVGDHTITAQMRSRVWIIHAKRAVRRCRARCTHCISGRIQPATAGRADLPDFRLDINQKAFFFTGCDLFGPYTVYAGRTRRKTEIHIVLFTCMVTRAVFLEVLDDKSTETFLVAFDKLWARHGFIAHMYTDCALNFVGAANVLKQDPVQQMMIERKIHWHFNPPYTPQFGGCWERLGRDIKRGIDASIGKFIVPKLAVEAALAKIESNLNNRPLTDVPVSSMDDIPVTPHILMTGYPNYPGMDDSSNKELQNPPSIMKLKQANRVQSLVQAFRHRFITEYATKIASRPVNNTNPHRLIKLDDYVVYMDETKNPADWKCGVICRTYPGKDGAVRVADIKLKDGTILERRSAHLIAKIDIRLEHPEAEQKSYTTTSNVTIKTNSNDRRELLKPVEVSNKSKQHAEKMEFVVKTKKLTQYPAHAGREASRATNVQLTEQQVVEYINYSGEKLIFCQNLPPKFGAGEIFAFMSEFGTVKMIGSSSYSGVNPQNFVIGYEDRAMVDTAMLHNESQLIEVDKKVFKPKFSRMAKNFIPTRIYKKPLFMFLNLDADEGETQRILLITNGVEDALGHHKTLPVSNGLDVKIHLCPRQLKYSIDSHSLRDRTVADIPAEIKTDNKSGETPSSEFLPTSTRLVGACFHKYQDDNNNAVHKQRSIRSSEDTITITTEVIPEDADAYGRARHADLREILTKRREIKAIKTVILKPHRQ